MVAPQPFFSPRGTPFSVYYRCLVLAERGMRVDLLTYGEGDDVEIRGLRIIRIPHPRFLRPVPIGPSLRKACLDAVMLLWTIGLLTRRRYAIVHAHEEAAFFCGILARIVRVRFVYDMHSSLPQQLRNFEFTSSRALIGLFGWLERRCLARADAVITICPKLAEQALASGVDPSRHVLIENSLFDPVSVRNGARQAGSAGDGADSANLVDTLSGTPGLIVYAGTLEPYQGIDMLLESIAALAERAEGAHLAVAGGTPAQVAAARAKADALGLRTVSFLGQLAKQDAWRLIRGATVVVSPRTTGSNTPLKIYELLASGVPLVATRIESHTQVLDDQVAELCEPDAASFAAAIRRVLTDRNRRAQLAANARGLYEARYARHHYVERIDSVLRLCGLAPLEPDGPAPVLQQTATSGDGA